jgi:Tfp pilus assembly PilM family ATPase
MQMDEAIDMIAFGATTQKVSSCLGLYLSPETIYIAETHLEKGKVIVDHLVRIPVPAAEAAKSPAGPTTATLNTDFLLDNAKLSALIRQSMSQVKWGTKDVMITLSHHLGLLRYFAMPAVDKRFWKSSVPLEAKKYIPIPFELLSHDYQCVPLPAAADGKPRQGALVAVTQKKNLANISALLESPRSSKVSASI